MEETRQGTLRQELIALNVDLACEGQCEDCEKFFDCELSKKVETFARRRMEKARKSMAGIKHKVLSLGGKGGVGKTLIAANLAMALAMRGRKVSILDQTFDGPCVPRMLGVEGKGIGLTEEGLIPAEGPLGIQVVSMGLIMAEDEALTWFHDMKRNATEEFLCHVLYGPRDYLIIDVPAGTSSDTVNLIQYIPELDGATVVTVPSEVSQAVALKAIALCRKAKVPVFGVFENMGTFVCPECGDRVDILQSGGGQRLAEQMDAPFLGSIPMDRRVAECADDGSPVVYKYPDCEASQIINAAVDLIENKIWRG